MYYTESYEEYDDLISKNIIFIDLFDAGANTAIVECIIRNTPIIISKLEGVVDYLGDDYPLYFTNLNEIPDLLTINKIKQAYYYLLNMKKDDLKIETFISNLYNNLFSHLNF